MKQKIHKVLIAKFPYYQKLSPMAKAKFRHRTENFLKKKKFLPRQGVDLTDDVKILIAAPAIQLTMGLKEFMFWHFDTIILFPGPYRSPYTNTTHLGETNTSGIIVFSWPEFEKGLQEDDGYNLGIHEFSHAMHLAIILEKYADPFFAEYFDKWESFAEKELKRIAKGETGVFRKFSGRNVHEIFAVCSEHFFEKAAEFKRDAPELYFHTCRLFQQDPLGKNMIFKKNSTFSERIKTPAVPKAYAQVNTRSVAAQLKLMFSAFIFFGVFSIFIQNGFFGFLAPMALVYFFQHFYFNRHLLLFDDYLVFKPRYFWQSSLEKTVFLEDIINAGIGVNHGNDGGVFSFQFFIYKNGSIDKLHASTGVSEGSAIKDFLLEKEITSRAEGNIIRKPKKRKRRHVY